MIGNARECERPVDQLEECAFFALDETMRLRESEVFARGGVFFQACTVGFVGGKRLELDEPPGNVIGSLVRKKIAEQMTAAARDDGTPVFSVRLERRALEWVDVVTDKTDDAHGPYRRRLHSFNGSSSVEP
jgi:hypothetical protein